MERKGIDISTWQGDNVDFNKLKGDGIEFVIIRSGFGSSTNPVDGRFEKNYKKAKEASMPIGTYWYAYALSVEDAKKEAQSCINTIKGKQFEYPIYYDVEDRTLASLNKAVRSDIVVAFCEALEEAGYFAGVYANLNWLNNHLDYNKIKPYTVWLAQWASKPTYKNSFDMWQYTSDGTTSGTPGRTDMDICYRDFPSEIISKGLNGYTKVTYKPVTDEVVNDVIRGKYGNGSTRKQKLEEEGYSPQEVQDAVNEKLLGTNVIRIGDKVKLKPTATNWVTGQRIPTWVYQKVLYVRSIPTNGKCNVSTLQSGAITGVIYTKDLTKIQ